MQIRISRLLLSLGCDAIDLSSRLCITASFAICGRTCSGRIHAGHEASREMASGCESKDALMATMTECGNVRARGWRLRESPVRLPLPAVAVIGDTSTDKIPAACGHARISCGEQGGDDRDHMLAPW